DFPLWNGKVIMFGSNKGSRWIERSSVLAVNLYNIDNTGLIPTHQILVALVFTHQFTTSFVYQFGHASVTNWIQACPITNFIDFNIPTSRSVKTNLCLRDH